MINVCLNVHLKNTNELGAQKNRGRERGGGERRGKGGRRGERMERGEDGEGREWRGEGEMCECDT